MKKCWNWLLGIALFSLLFIAVPVTISGDGNKENLRPMFDEYIVKFNKSYKNDPAEYETRFKYFLESLDEITKLNAESHGPDEHRARYGLTHLSDMSKSEYRDIHLSDEKLLKAPHLYGRSWKSNNRLSYTVVNEIYNEKKLEIIDLDNKVYERKKRASLPLKVDWRSKGVIGPVRNQGLCGGCWAFSTVGMMEAMAAINTGKLVTLSVQEAIDCAAFGNSGCAGGDICLLLDWLTMTNTTVVPDSEYPLRNVDSVCLLRKNVTGVRVSAFTCDNFVGTEDKILEAIATHGPVAVAVNGFTWQNYLGGVIQYHCGGSIAELNHAVQLVGYDLTADVPYYIAKNSWGTEFGNEGYLKLSIGNNICGLANEVSTLDVK